MSSEARQELDIRTRSVIKDFCQHFNLSRSHTSLNLTLFFAYVIYSSSAGIYNRNGQTLYATTFILSIKMAVGIFVCIFTYLLDIFYKTTKQFSRSFL